MVIAQKDIILEKKVVDLIKTVNDNMMRQIVY